MLDQSAGLLPEDSRAVQNVVTPLADWEVDRFAVLLPADSAAVQVLDFLTEDSQEWVSYPVPTRWPALITRRKTELPLTSSA